MAAEMGLGHQCWHQPVLGDGGLATQMVLVSPSARALVLGTCHEGAGPESGWRKAQGWLQGGPAAVLFFPISE